MKKFFFNAQIVYNKFNCCLPLSVSGTGAVESQLQVSEAPAQLWFMPHWQVWTLADSVKTKLPAQLLLPANVLQVL